LQKPLIFRRFFAHAIVGEPLARRSRWHLEEPYTKPQMDKILHHIFNGAVALIRVPLLLLLMTSIVISLVRRPRRELAPVRVPESLPPPA
jgi:hypothetical protein